MIDYAPTFDLMRKLSLDDLSAILSGAVHLVAAMEDRGRGAYPLMVEKEISAGHESLKKLMLNTGLLDPYKFDDGSVGIWGD